MTLFNPIINTSSLNYKDSTTTTAKSQTNKKPHTKPKNPHKTQSRLQEYIQYKVVRHPSCHEGFIILAEQHSGREKILLLRNYVLTRSYSPSVFVLRTSFQVAKFWQLLSLHTLQHLPKNDLVCFFLLYFKTLLLKIIWINPDKNVQGNSALLEAGVCI